MKSISATYLCISLSYKIFYSLFFVVNAITITVERIWQCVYFIKLPKCFKISSALISNDYFKHVVCVWNCKLWSYFCSNSLITSNGLRVCSVLQFFECIPTISIQTDKVWLTSLRLWNVSIYLPSFYFCPICHRKQK